MAYVPHFLGSPFALATHHWNCWKTACDRAVTHYYNKRIELCPEAEAEAYWQRLQHPQSGVNVRQINDAMLSELMHNLLDEGISKFAVDRFILELRRCVRSAAR